MNATIVAESTKPVKQTRFVPAHAPDARTQYMRDYDAGYALYQADKRLPHNASEATRDGWQDAFNAGADAYYLAMMLEAN